MTKWRVLGFMLTLVGILGGSEPGAQPDGDGQLGAPASSAPARVEDTAPAAQQAPGELRPADASVRGSAEVVPCAQ
jgi:hypothetical protein